MGTKEFVEDVHTVKTEEQTSQYCRTCWHYSASGRKCRGLSSDSIYDVCEEHVDTETAVLELQHLSSLPSFLFFPKPL